MDKEIKEEAAKLAAELGVSFSSVVNSMLKNFVRERRLVLSSEPEINANTRREYEEILRDIEAGKNLMGPYSSVAELKEALMK